MDYIYAYTYILISLSVCLSVCPYLCVCAFRCKWTCAVSAVVYFIWCFHICPLVARNNDSKIIFIEMRTFTLGASLYCHPFQSIYLLAFYVILFTEITVTSTVNADIPTSYTRVYVILFDFVYEFMEHSKYKCKWICHEIYMQSYWRRERVSRAALCKIVINSFMLNAARLYIIFALYIFVVAFFAYSSLDSFFFASSRYALHWWSLFFFIRWFLFAPWFCVSAWCLLFLPRVHAHFIFFFFIYSLTSPALQKGYS